MKLVSLAYPAAGNNTATSLAYLSQSEAGRFIELTGNLRIHEGRYRTRRRVIAKPILGDDSVISEWQSLHTQQALWYEPRSGQGSHYIGVGPPRIIESAGGKLFSLTEKGLGFEVQDISAGMKATAKYRLAWLCQAENYVIRTDGNSPVQIYDGKTTVGSPGYSSVAKEAARFPNGSGPTVYAGGRIYTVLFGRRIYASDSLHQTNQMNASDLLRFTDQTYDYINVYFAPPADDGDITAMTVTVDSGFDNSRAQGEVLSFCTGPSSWGVTLGISRIAWPTTNMRHSRSKETGATGPLAFWVRDGDILMRTPRGIESLNLLARERSQVGNSVIDLGVEMRNILARDSEEALLYCSMVNPLNLDRLFCTCTPIVEGLRHYHMGWVTANWNPMNERNPRYYAWEGLQTLPASIGKVIQFLAFRERGTSRMLALLDRGAGQKGLCELTQQDGHDIDADGNHVPIRQFMLTRRLSAGGPFLSSSCGTLRAFLDDARTDIKLEVLYRTDRQRDFKLHRVLDIEVVDGKGQPVVCADGGEGGYDLGKPLADEKNIRWVQFLFRWTGVTSIDFAMEMSEPAALTNQAVDDCVRIETDPYCYFDPFADSL